MDKRNRIVVGALLGLVLPVLLFTILYQLFNLMEQGGAASGRGLSANFRERTLAIVAIALNLVLLNQFQKRRWDKALRGVVVATGVLAIAWVVRYGLQMF
jgi:hypothetical protein